MEIQKKEKTAKVAFLKSIEEAIDFLLIDWEKINSANPALALNNSVSIKETIIGESLIAKKLLGLP